MNFERWFFCTEYKEIFGHKKWVIIDVKENISYNPHSKEGDKYIRSALIPICKFTPNFLIPFFIKFKINDYFKPCESFRNIIVKNNYDIIDEKIDENFEKLNKSIDEIRKI